LHQHFMVALRSLPDLLSQHRNVIKKGETLVCTCKFQYGDERGCLSSLCARCDKALGAFAARVAFVQPVFCWPPCTCLCLCCASAASSSPPRFSKHLMGSSSCFRFSEAPHLLWSLAPLPLSRNSVLIGSAHKCGKQIASGKLSDDCSSSSLFLF